MIKLTSPIRLLSVYWRSADRWCGGWLAAGVLGLGLAETWLLVQYNGIYAGFFNALQQGNTSAFWAAVPLLLLLLAAPMFTQVIKAFLDAWLQLRWRFGTTDYVIVRWLSGKAYYRIERDAIGDNPDQRISEDVSKLIDLTMALTVRLVTTLASLASFGYLTWTQGGSLDFKLFSFDFHIPGYMFWVAVIYAVFDIAITHLAGKSLLRLNFRREAAEAELRYSLMQVRENAEQIAMYEGEAVEHNRLLAKFGSVWQVSKRLFIVDAQVSFASGFSSRLMAILPLVLMAPSMLAGKMDLGTMMATTAAWVSTAMGLAWFGQNYSTIAQWLAAARRLELLEDAIDAGDPPQIQLIESDGLVLCADDLVLASPAGVLLSNVGSFTFAPGQRWMISGRSGAGKSTLLRAIAGLWRFGGGTIQIPSQSTRLFLPQKSYIPAGSLKSALCYPSRVEDFSDEDCFSALDICCLSDLKPNLHEQSRWSSRLSGGEQQRVAFARAFLHKPDFLFLDEATSALDGATEDRLYTALVDRLGHTTIISVAHREAVQKFHSNMLVLKANDQSRSHSLTTYSA